MKAYYNEIEPYCVQWLKNLISAKLITPGEVDERSIELVEPDDLTGFHRVHLFAGIGGWDYALQLAAWPPDRPVWTGSCPCQPFSTAGKKLGTADKRHLWPEMHRLIGARKPPVVFGEQVASPAGRDWLSGVRTDLEGMGYEVGAGDICAAGVRAPHVRQRLYWVAGTEFHEGGPEYSFDLKAPGRYGPGGRGPIGGLGNSYGPGSQGRGIKESGEYPDQWVTGATGAFVGLAEPHGGGRQDTDLHSGPGQPGEITAHESGSNYRLEDPGFQQSRGSHPGPAETIESAGKRAPDEPGRSGDAWGSYDWLYCLDGKTRRIESGTFPVANGIPARVGRCRAYGNAIVPPLAAEFITAWMEVRP